MIEITYNRASDLGKGWVSGSQRFKSWEAVGLWIKEQLEQGYEVLITSFTDV